MNSRQICLVTLVHLSKMYILHRERVQSFRRKPSCIYHIECAQSCFSCGQSAQNYCTYDNVNMNMHLIRPTAEHNQVRCTYLHRNLYKGERLIVDVHVQLLIDFNVTFYKEDGLMRCFHCEPNLLLFCFWDARNMKVNIRQI